MYGLCLGSASRFETAEATPTAKRFSSIRHALKNALIPVITYIGLWLPILVGGTVIIETIFGLPGMGELIVESTRLRDYPVVSGTLIIFGCGMVVINLLVDLMYGYLNPQVHYR